MHVTFLSRHSRVEAIKRYPRHEASPTRKTCEVPLGKDMRRIASYFDFRSSAAG